MPPLYVHALVFQDASRPVVNLSYALDRALWGPAPFGFHLTSLLLHALNVGLVFALVRGYRARVMRWRWVATASALALCGPSHDVAGGWLHQRAIGSPVRHVVPARAAVPAAAGTGQARWLGLATGCWLVAAASREVAVMFPLVGLAAHALGRRTGVAGSQRRTTRWLMVDAHPCGPRGCGRGSAVFLTLEHSQRVRPDWDLALVEVDVTRRYLQMLVLPGEQSVFHAVAPISRLLSARLLGGLAVIAALITAVWRLRRVAPLASLGGLWFLLLLVPSAALVVLDRGEPMAEHRVYLASIGVFLMAGVAIERADRGSSSRLSWRAGSGVAAWRRSSSCSVPEPSCATPPGATRSCSGPRRRSGRPDHWLPHIPLGESLHAAGRHDEAAPALRMALQLRPWKPEARRKLGICLVEAGDLNGAAAVFERLDGGRARSWEAPRPGDALVALARGDNGAARGGSRRSPEGSHDE